MEFKDDYKTMSGWIHDYYCDKDGAELIFDISNNKYFECPICHHKYNDEKRKRAWIIKYRYKIFNTIEEYSKKYLEEKDKNYLEYIELALEYYSLNYDKFAIHNKNGEIFYDYKNGENRCGKITGQGLNEAMISIQIVNCIDNIGDALSYEIKKDCFNILFPQIYELLKPQVNKIRNIECYEICAIAMMGIISNNKEMLDYAFNSQFSFYSQIEEGVNKDYFWFEGSFHYHLFVLKPILELLKIARKYQYQIPEKYYNIAKEMLMQSYKCSFADGSLPSPNDGWANRHLSAYIKDFELGEEIFNGEFDKIINKINNNNYGTIHCFNFLDFLC